VRGEGHERVLGARCGGGGNEAELASYLIETSGGYGFSEELLEVSQVEACEDLGTPSQSEGRTKSLACSRRVKPPRPDGAQ